MKNQLETDRSLLRHWRAEDLSLFAIINSDPKVMEYFPATMTEEESNNLASKINNHFEEYGYGLWAVEEKSSKKFIGFTGLSNTTFDAHFTPSIEIGWRLELNSWSKGYATEAARKVLDYALNKLNLAEIVSFTANKNTPSRRVMEKIGLNHNPKDDFNHPNLPVGHHLSSHVLYRSKY